MAEAFELFEKDIHQLGESEYQQAIAKTGLGCSKLEVCEQYKDDCRLHSCPKSP